MKFARKARKLSQEQFGLVSSRTYVSTLERGEYSPTLNKVDQLAEVLDIHPLTLITLAYVQDCREKTIQALQARIAMELAELGFE